MAKWQKSVQHIRRIKEQAMLALRGQPMLAGIDDEGDVDALHDGGDP